VTWIFSVDKSLHQYCLHACSVGFQHKEGTEYVSPFSCANLLASMKVTSLSDSRSLLFPTKTMTMLGLARVRASVSQLVRALYVSRLVGRREEGRERKEGEEEKKTGEGEGFEGEGMEGRGEGGKRRGRERRMVKRWKGGKEKRRRGGEEGEEQKGGQERREKEVRGVDARQFGEGPLQHLGCPKMLWDIQSHGLKDWQLKLGLWTASYTSWDVMVKSL